jgi:hypothetical protein
MKDIDHRTGNAVAMTNNYGDFKKRLQKSLKVKE